MTARLLAAASALAHVVDAAQRAPTPAEIEAVLRAAIAYARAATRHKLYKRVWAARKRAEARRAGLCLQCCRRQAEADRVRCVRCLEIHTASNRPRPRGSDRRTAAGRLAGGA